MAALVESFVHAEGTAAPWWDQSLKGTGAKTWEEFQKAAGLDWKVVKTPLFRFPEGPVPVSAQPHIRSKGSAIVRLSDGRELGVVGLRYTPIQNETVFQWFNPWVEAGLATFETAGSLKNGEIVWALAAVQGLDAEVQKGDKVRRYIMLSNSHDGSTGILNGTIDTRPVCWNTMKAARAEGTLGSVRHTESAEQKLIAAQKSMTTLLGQFQADLANYKRLAEAPIANPTEVGEYVLDTFSILPKVGEKVKLSTRTDQMVKQILIDVYQGIGNKGETWWDAYNGVTQYLTHERGSNSEKRVVSNLFGDSQEKNKRALKLALEYAGVTA